MGRLPDAFIMAPRKIGVEPETRLARRARWLKRRNTL